jgi:hypothetical protein
MPITQLWPTGTPGSERIIVGGEKPSIGPLTQLWPCGCGGIVRHIDAKQGSGPGVEIPPGMPSDLSQAGPWTRLKLPIGGEDVDPLDLYERGTFTMEYNGNVVTLPLPIIGDEQTLESTVINRRTRGGRARVYRDLQWYSLHIYNYTFRRVREDDKDDFLALVRDAMAKPIKVIDHLDQVFIDMYIVSVGPITEERNDNCSYTLELSLQVVR